MALLRAGECVAFPTETVYGLGADACNERAVAAVFAAKGRPPSNPLIVHVAGLREAMALAEFSSAAVRLAERFWPGPLTLVLTRKADTGLAAAISAGLPSVALRVPAHPVAQRLLAAFGEPLAAPSANPSGRVSPTTARHVMEGLGGRIAAVIDGGTCGVGIESTVLSLCGPHPVLLRAGGVPREALLAAGLDRLDVPDPAQPAASPGMLESHYATRAPIRLNADRPRPGELWLGFGDDMQGEGLNLSPAGDLAEAAANLFSHLRALDEMLAARGQGGGIAVARIPDTGLGAAINDRLRRAAAPRTAQEAAPC
ncbi:MAG: threonylcarbamoyl-AMP synthase [Alphaproteobacteria bacterium]|nr:MAG: threonylcarbamoyl-AMP synthase [Alphaproteobacteria bacterium]